MRRTAPDWKRVRRIDLGPRRTAIRELEHFGRYNYAAARSGLLPHHHGDSLEICYLVRGRQVYAVQGEYFPLAGGDLFVTFPGELHGTAGLPQEKGVLYWIILRLGLKAPFLGLPPQEGKRLRAALLGLRRRSFRGGRRIGELLDRLMADCLEEASDSLAPLRQRALLLDFLLEVEAAGRAAEEPIESRARSLGRVVQAIHQRIEEPWRIPELAALAGLSVPQLQARFRKEFGVPPGEYVLRTKIEEAKRRLRETETPVTRIGFDLGFGSSQYFATVFKRYTGRTPTETRNASRRRPSS